MVKPLSSSWWRRFASVSSRSLGWTNCDWAAFFFFFWVGAVGDLGLAPDERHVSVLASRLVGLDRDSVPSSGTGELDRSPAEEELDEKDFRSMRFQWSLMAIVGCFLANNVL